jgi:hypothetical protein
LVIDADTVLPGSGAFESFQPVAWGNAQIVQPACLVQLLQFPACCGFEVDKARDTLPVE